MFGISGVESIPLDEPSAISTSSFLTDNFIACFSTSSAASSDKNEFLSNALSMCLKFFKGCMEI